MLHAGVALTIRHIANGETVLLVAKNIRGHCATVAKRFSERTYRIHLLCSPHIFLFWPRRTCGGERVFAKIGFMERVLLIFVKKVLTEVDFLMKWLIYIQENDRIQTGDHTHKGGFN